MSKFKLSALESFKNWISNIKKKKGLLPAIVFLIIGMIILMIIWRHYVANTKGNIISANGRIEATEINIAPKFSGRVKEILVNEGDYVKTGDIIAYMDTDTLNAQLREAQGKLRQANNSITINQSILIQKKSAKMAAEAVVKQREAELEVAEKRWGRSSRLVAEGAASQQTADDDWAAYKSAIAAKDVSFAHIGAADAAIVTAQEEVIGAESAVEATKGQVERIEADIKDSALKTFRDGRVQYRIAQPGEVVGAGSPVLSLVDLTDVYMTFFLPTAYAGRVAIGEEVRLVLDAAPKYVFPAYISFVSDVAQFTPKTVETTSERDKFVFRVKAQIPTELLQQYSTRVKTGLPGKAYMRLDSSKSWPRYLKVNI